ncbi:MAG: hypothetical protein K9N21_10425 [Deltaproteobacteria bacterium]|nr:hypothetical protein [Deltaproteobacteria bacterium]
MVKGTTFHLDEDLRIRLKMAVAQRKTTIKDVLCKMIQEYVEETETMTKKKGGKR